MAVRILQFDTYFEIIKKSTGSDLFYPVYAEVNGTKMDITNRGQFSCAAHVSSILLWFALVEERHTGVAGLVSDMLKSGWYKTDELRPGSVLHWERKMRNGGENEHLGFYIGNEKAISNDPTSGTPIEHHYTYGEENNEPKRKIEAIYWHPKLDEKGSSKSPLTLNTSI